MQLYKVFLRQRWFDSLSDVANRLTALSVLKLKMGICLMYRRCIIGVLFLQPRVLFVGDI